MSIDKYNAIASEINHIYKCSELLPVMKSAPLYITTKTIAGRELSEEIGTKYNQGWQLYTDELTISQDLKSGGTLLEAEFSNKKTSLKIKLLHDDLYLVTSYSSEKSDKNEEKNLENCMNYSQLKVCGKSTSLLFENCVYYDQLVKIRRKLRKAGYSNAKYRFWYHESSESKGRWEALAQQFIEFTGEEK